MVRSGRGSSAGAIQRHAINSECPAFSSERKIRVVHIDAIGALGMILSTADIAAIERVVPKHAAAGSRYPSAAMAELDSEK